MIEHTEEVEWVLLLKKLAYIVEKSKKLLLPSFQPAPQSGELRGEKTGPIRSGAAAIAQTLEATPDILPALTYCSLSDSACKFLWWVVVVRTTRAPTKSLNAGVDFGGAGLGEGKRPIACAINHTTHNGATHQRFWTETIDWSKA